MTTNTNQNEFTGGENLKMKNQLLNEREKKLVAILKKYTRKNNKNGKKNKANKQTKKRVNFKLGAEKKRNNKGTRKVNQKNMPSAKQVKIRNRTLTPMPMSSSL